MLFLKEDTNSYVRVGPFIDATDGYTIESGLTMTGADVFISKGQGAFSGIHNSTQELFYDAYGFYQCLLDATDTSTVGMIQLTIQKSGARPIYHEFMVMAVDSYDRIFGNSGNYPVSTADIADAVWWYTMDEAGEWYEVIQIMRLLSSVLLGKVSGMETGSPVFRDISDTKNRITAAVDTHGNRSSVTVNSAD